MNADRAVRWATVLAVVAVAGVAAYVSYWHTVEVVTGHREPGVIGHLYPVLIDGIIIAASMVLLDAARHSEAAPRLAWWMLGSGVSVTLAANVAYGAQGGLASALWASWPAFAFVGCYELLMLLVRASARRAGAGGNQQGIQPAPAPDPVYGPVVPSDAEHAATIALRATLAAGNPYTVNALASKFSLPRTVATKLHREVVAAGNGHVTGEEVSGDGQ